MSEPIAVVGMACLFPGASSPEALFELSLEGRTCFRPIPESRWRHDAFHDASPRGLDTSWAPAGAFLDDFERFASACFGIAPRRAEVMDPQHRLLIEATRWALQDAGLERGGLERARTGVFVGLSVSEFKNAMMARIRLTQAIAGDFGAALDGPDAARLLGAVDRVARTQSFSLSGSLQALAAASVAQTFDLGGPAFTIDAACASANVAIHDAVTHLRAGALDVALAGGVYLNLSPDNLVAFTRIGAISPSGRCRPFDADADGFVQGEGVATFVLKRERDVDPTRERVHALILGSGCNNDGRGEGPMTPRVEGQVAVLRAACEDAGLDPRELDYVEAHGTATAGGDRTETRALAEVFGDRERPLWIGSVKGNIGHAMSAAGAAGLVRAIGVLRRGVVPRQAGLKRLHPELPLGDGRLAVPTDNVALDALPGRPLRVGVSAFGFGGTNSHLVLAAPPPPRRRAEPVAETLVVSADTADGARRMAREVSEALARDGAGSLADAAWTLGVTRTLAPYRAALTGSRAALAAAAGSLELVAPGAAPPSVAFCFAPDGEAPPRWLPSALRRFPALAARVDELDAALARAGSSRLDDTSAASPVPARAAASLALSLALARWLGDRGVRPDATFGAELALSAWAGELTDEEALRRALSGDAPAPDADFVVEADVVVGLGGPRAPGLAFHDRPEDEAAEAVLRVVGALVARGVPFDLATTLREDPFERRVTSLPETPVTREPYPALRPRARPAEPTPAPAPPADVRARVLEAVALVCAMDVSQVSEERRLIADLGMDSILLIELGEELALDPAVAESLFGAEATVAEVIAHVAACEAPAASARQHADPERWPEVDRLEEQLAMMRALQLEAHPARARQAGLTFAAHDPLGFARDPRVIAAAREAMGAGTVSSFAPATARETEAQRRLERRLAAVFEAEAALSIGAGGCPFAPITSTFARADDLVVHVTRLADPEPLHTAARVHRASPDDLPGLDAWLDAHRDAHERALLCVARTCDVDGTALPVDALRELAERRGVVLVVDHTRSLGLADPSPGAAFDVARLTHLGASGVVVAGRERALRLLRHQTRHAPPAEWVIAALDAALDGLDGARTARVRERVEALRALATSAGARATASPASATVFLRVGDTPETLRVWRALLDRGVETAPIGWPRVAERDAGLRLVVSVRHEDADLRAAADALHAALRPSREKEEGTPPCAHAS